MPRSPEFFVSFGQEDWDLHRKGPADQARHTEKVWEAIKENLADIVANENIITSDGKDIVKVPIRSLDHPHFRFDPKNRTRAGTGSGGSKPGDIIAQGPVKDGKGKRAGNQPGVDYIEVGITIDELAELIFADLELPHLKPKTSEPIETTHYRFTDIRKKGPMSNLDKRKTVLENIKRNALAGNPRVGNISEDDLRFKTWTRSVRQESNAVVIAMRDVSASMGEFEKYITRSFYFWMVRFLRTRYQNVQIVFITHHTEAQIVEEKKFFELGESGGTRVSSAYQLALDTIEQRFDPNRWNIYPFHFSDGDNWGESDNTKCVELVNKLLEKCNIFGYGEIQEREPGISTLMASFSTISDPRFISVTIRNKKEVHPALKKFFHKETVEGAVSRL